MAKATLNQSHWTRISQIFQRILFFGAWYLYVPLWSALLLSVIIINHHGPTSARSLQLHHSQTIISFSDAHLLGTSSCRTETELMCKSKHLLNFETIRLMKLELLWCAAAFYSVCAPPKALLMETLFWTVESNLTKLELMYLWVQSVYCLLQKYTLASFCSEFIH